MRNIVFCTSSPIWNVFLLTTTHLFSCSISRSSLNRLSGMLSILSIIASIYSSANKTPCLATLHVCKLISTHSTTSYHIQARTGSPWSHHAKMLDAPIMPATEPHATSWGNPLSFINKSDQCSIARLCLSIGLRIIRR
jgi:hypothetical protein